VPTKADDEPFAAEALTLAPKQSHLFDINYPSLITCSRFFSALFLSGFACAISRFVAAILEMLTRDSLVEIGSCEMNWEKSQFPIQERERRYVE